MECGFENGEEFFEVEFFLDFVLDSVRKIQINLQVTLIINRLVFVIAPPVNEMVLYFLFQDLVHWSVIVIILYY